MSDTPKKQNTIYDLLTSEEDLSSKNTPAVTADTNKTTSSTFFLSGVDTKNVSSLMPEPLYFDEIVDDASLQEIAAGDNLLNMLKPAHDILKEIHNYCINNNIQKTSTKPDGQFFFYKNTYFILDDLSHISNIEAITVNRNKLNLFKTLSSFFSEHNVIFEKVPLADILKTIPANVTAKIVSNVFTQEALTELEERGNSALPFPLNNMSNKVGYCILPFYIQTVIKLTSNQG